MPMIQQFLKVTKVIEVERFWKVLVSNSKPNKAICKIAGSDTLRGVTLVLCCMDCIAMAILNYEKN